MNTDTNPHFACHISSWVSILCDALIKRIQMQKHKWQSLSIIMDTGFVFLYLNPVKWLTIAYDLPLSLLHDFLEQIPFWSFILFLLSCSFNSLLKFFCLNQVTTAIEMVVWDINKDACLHQCYYLYPLPLLHFDRNLFECCNIQNRSLFQSLDWYFWQFIFSNIKKITYFLNNVNKITEKKNFSYE